MYRCLVLTALVAVAALGAEIDITREQSQPLDELCLRDKYPSATCRFKCHSKNLKPYCDRDKKKCLCKTSEEHDDDDDFFDDLFSDDDDPSNKINNKKDSDDYPAGNDISNKGSDPAKKKSQNKKEKNSNDHQSKKRHAKKDDDDDNLFDDLFFDGGDSTSDKNTVKKDDSKNSLSDGSFTNGDSNLSKKNSIEKKSHKNNDEKSHKLKKHSGTTNDSGESFWDDLFDDDDDNSSKKKHAVKEHAKVSPKEKMSSHKDTISHHKSEAKKHKPDNWFNDLLSDFDDQPPKSNSAQKHKPENIQAKPDEHSSTQKVTKSDKKTNKKKDNDNIFNSFDSLFDIPWSIMDDGDSKKKKDNLPSKTHSDKDKHQTKSKEVKKKDDGVVNDFFSTFDGDDSNKKSDTKKNGKDKKDSSADQSSLDDTNKPIKELKKNNSDDGDSLGSDLASLINGLESLFPQTQDNQPSQKQSNSDKDKHPPQNKKTDETSKVQSDIFSSFDQLPKSKHEKKTSGESSANSSTESHDSLSNKCDKDPSISCKFRCHGQNLEAYCDQKQKKCLCKPPSGMAMMQNLFDDLFLNGDDNKKAATSSKKHSGDSLSKKPESLQQESDKCFADKYPSSACKSKCDSMQMQAYCDKDMRQCLCRMPTDKNNSNIFNDFLLPGDGHVSTTPSPFQQITPTSAPVQPIQELGELCFFGNTPSATCRFKCESVNMKPYCDKDLKKCLCKEDFEKPSGIVSSLDESAHQSPELDMASDALKMDKPLGEICFYDKYPSATCKYNCHLKNLQPYCDQESHKCLCRPFQNLLNQSSGLPSLLPPLPPLPFFNFGSPFLPSEPTVKNSETCFFDRIPSTACTNKCNARNMDAHCNQFLHKCECKEKDKNLDNLFNLDILGNHNDQPAFKPFNPVESPFNRPSGEVVPSPTEPEAHKPLRIIYFLNPFKTDHHVPENKGTDSKPSSTGVPPIITKILHDEMSRPHWSFQHTMAVVIIALLAVLIFLELYACHKRRVGKNNMDTMFSTVPGKV